MPTYAKAHALDAIVFDGASMQDFDNVASVGAGVANTTVQARLPVPQACKIYKVVANFSAIGSGGAHSFNIVVGTGAEGSVGSVDTNAIAGTTVFQGDQNLATGTADTPQVFNAAVWDTIYPTGSLLTLRAVTPATTGSLTNLKVILLVKFIDPTPSTNGTGFSPSIF